MDPLTVTAAQAARLFGITTREFQANAAPRGDQFPAPCRILGSGTTVADYLALLTFRKDETKARTFIEAVWGKIEIDGLSPSMVKSGLDAIKQRYDDEGFAGADRANRVRTVLAKVCQRATDQGGLERNPVRELRPFKHKQTPHEVWPVESLKRALTELRPDLALVVAIAAYTGQRRGDVLTMTWNDIQIRDGRKFIKVVQSKTGAKLSIPLWPALEPFLAAARGRAAQLRRQHGRIDDTICLSTRGTAWSAKGLDDRLAHHLNTLGIPQRLHGLRHTAGVTLAEAGCTNEQIRAVLGHSSFEQSQVYVPQVQQEILASEAFADIAARGAWAK